MIILTFILSSFYIILIGAFILGFAKLPDFKLSNLSPKIKFSVIVPFRNEVANLPVLLNSFSNLTYLLINLNPQLMPLKKNIQL